MMNRYPDSIYDRRFQILNFFNEKMKIYKEKTFKLLTLWGPFLLGFIVSNKEKDIGFKNLFEHTQDKIKDIVGNDYLEFEKLLLPKNTTLQEERLMLELLGIHKSFGHPRIDIDIPETLRLPLLKKEYPNQSLHKSLDLWHDVEFCKIFDYDCSADTSELLQDSSLAPPFSVWFSGYDPCAFLNGYKKKKPRFGIEKKELQQER